MSDSQEHTDSFSWQRPKGLSKVVSEFLLRLEGTKYVDIEGVAWIVFNNQWSLLPKGEEFQIDPTNIV